MKKKKLQKSFRKHIRREKARIRRSVLSSEKREKLIEELHKKYFAVENNSADKKL